MNRKKKTIAIDMDGVLADVETQFELWYERDYGMKIERSARLGVPESEGFPDKGAVRKFVYTPGFFRTIPLMTGAVEAVQQLMEHYEVYVVSAAMEFPQCLSEKREWLDEHFPFIDWRNIVFCGDKSIIDTDYMIDDHCKNLDFFKGKAIMFDAPHNSEKTHHVRVKSWAEVLTLMGPENLIEA